MPLVDTSDDPEQLVSFLVSQSEELGCRCGYHILFDRYLGGTSDQFNTELNDFLADEKVKTKIFYEMKKKSKSSVKSLFNSI